MEFFVDHLIKSSPKPRFSPSEFSRGCPDCEVLSGIPVYEEVVNEHVNCCTYHLVHLDLNISDRDNVSG